MFQVTAFTANVSKQVHKYSEKKNFEFSQPLVRLLVSCLCVFVCFFNPWQISFTSSRSWRTEVSSLEPKLTSRSKKRYSGSLMFSLVRLSTFTPCNGGGLSWYKGLHLPHYQLIRNSIFPNNFWRYPVINYSYPTSGNKPSQCWLASNNCLIHWGLTSCCCPSFSVPACS